MKKQSISSISKLGLVLVFFATFLTATAHGKPRSLPTISADVKYLGTVDESILFDVVFDNPNGKKFSVIVLDEEGAEIFQESYNDKKFNKRFMLPKSEKDKFTFVIRNFKDADLKQSFEIKTRITEDVVVTKVN